MVKIGLQIKANLENCTNLKPVGEDFRWYLKLKCLNCGEVPDKWQYLCLQCCVHPLWKRNRVHDGYATFQGRMLNSLGWDGPLSGITSATRGIEYILPDSIGSYCADDSLKFKTIVAFDCRGLEPTDFDARIGWFVEGAETGTKFQEVNLSEKEWVEYDEKAKDSVGVYELQHKFVKV